MEPQACGLPGPSGALLPAAPAAPFVGKKVALVGSQLSLPFIHLKRERFRPAEGESQGQKLLTQRV